MKKPILRTYGTQNHFCLCYYRYSVPNGTFQPLKRIIKSILMCVVVFFMVSCVLRVRKGAQRTQSLTQSVREKGIFILFLKFRQLLKISTAQFLRDISGEAFLSLSKSDKNAATPK